jgi:hypothetical protein
MSDFQRGAVVKATFEIEYPDGSRKVTELDNPQDVGSVVFDAASVPAGDEGLFNVSESDWKQNPSMIIYPKTSGAEGIPHCTHNGCKS